MNTAAVPSNKFTWLLKREFWEYRGAFFWTPAITTMVMLAFVVIALIIGETSAHRAGVNINGMHLDEITKHLNEGDAGKLYAGLNMGLLGLGFPIGIALYFVLLFYGIGALYNDRADRSVLFWKSLPISDTETVLSKVVAMALVAPLLAVGAMIALHLGFLVIMSLWVLIHGISPVLLWSPAHLLALWAKLLLLIPINALWALPSIGWLLLCSSFARTKPFLWAVMLPIVAGVLTSIVHLMNSLSLPSGWFWQNVVGRLLLSLVPGTWIDVTGLQALGHDEDRLPQAINDLFSFGAVGHLFASPTFLIGIAAGAAMIFGAIHFRRQRTESYA
jgi:ABC-2 type transport system permease protein